MNNRVKLVVITGPTAVGKSDFAVRYALENNGEIISADSRQVYKGLDIGTGKITKEEMRGVPHHLLDVIDPKKKFNVEQYRELASKKIGEIVSRGKLPIVCGGTGFYIDALVNNIYYPDVPHNDNLRKEIENKNTKELFEILKSIDDIFANSLNNSERNNKQRLIRSIEIGRKLGKIPKTEKSGRFYSTKWIGLTTSTENLKKRIHSRLLKRIEDGMIEEVKKLNGNGLSWKRMEELGLEYRYIARHLQKELTLEEMKNKLEMEIWHYAKRQMVWFKKNKEMEWVEVK